MNYFIGTKGEVDGPRGKKINYSFDQVPASEEEINKLLKETLDNSETAEDDKLKLTELAWKELKAGGFVIIEGKVIQAKK